MSWQWRIMQKLKGNWHVVSKLMWELWWILTRALENLKHLHFNGLSLTKVHNAWAKKVQGSYAWWHWILMQNLKENWHEEFRKFSPEHLEVSKLGLWRNSFAQSWKYMSLKFTGELCVMTMKNDAKIDKELTCRFKIDVRTLKNFDPSTWKCQTFAL